jgi:predicted enzyme related to lactoylglutathione lyase
MPQRTSYAPGTFSWADLATSDPDAAKVFYTSLFGWETQDNPIPDGGVYTMLLKGGKPVAALSQLQAEGQPVVWNSYVTVASADDAAAAARDGGATLISEPFDVMDVGRMAVFMDPVGAVLCVWEPGTSIGAELVNEPGALTINQLNTGDPVGSQEFYSGVFGWRFEQVTDDEVSFWAIYNGDRLNGGMMLQEPAAWLVYFGSESADDDAGRIVELGGQVVVPPTPVPSGKFLVAQDPQGAFFALSSGEFDD